ncbi:MAG: hypothetical protein SYR96_20015 [Actinomycetota bacterium]|nr:hypothetical protein [Actinomycetota bacterium]
MVARTVRTASVSPPAELPFPRGEAEAARLWDRSARLSGVEFPAV